MNKKQTLVSLLGTALIVALLAGAAVYSVLSGLGLTGCGAAAYLCALAGALVCALCALSPKMAVVGALLGVVAAGAGVAVNLGGGIRALLDGIAQMKAGEGFTALQGGASFLAGAASAALSLLLFVLLIDRSLLTTLLAAGLCLGCAVFSAAASGKSLYGGVIPAVAGTLAALAHTAEQRRTFGHLKALFPVCLAVALAVALTPTAGTVFPPLEKAAEAVRALYEEYFSYTQERVAFTISEQGYDFYGMLNDEPTHMLGGPATPSKEAVLQVASDSDLLLRGTVRSAYTGYSWVDHTAKSRNLYYDFTRRSRRSSVFQTALTEKLADSGAFRAVRGDVKLFKGTSSTLFTPLRLTEFDMALKNAVYYNSTGELFLARNVEKGDEYGFEAIQAVSPSELSALARRIADGGENALLKADKGYEEAVRNYTAVPDCVEDGVYKIAEALTEGKTTDAEQAQAILEALKASCKYALEVDYPPRDRDFVSYFLLDSREGYCSYFASAMAVLCRIQGIPARYVEGFRVYAEDDGVTNVTGEDAHAWVEVYLKGMGWVAYDPTPGKHDAPSGSENTDGDGQNEPTPSPTPSPTPDNLPEGDLNTPTPKPSSEPDDEPSTEPSTEPSAAPDDLPTPKPTLDPGRPQDQPQTKRNVAWLWILLIVLLVLLVLFLLWTALRRRLRKTDPIRLAAEGKSEERSVLILYRSMLTLLATMGQAPLSGETPAAFAKRVCAGGTDNPDFEEFAKGVMLMRYARRPAGRELTSLGARAYLQFRSQMSRTERLRFDLHRAFRGLGRFDVIP